MTIICENCHSENVGRDSICIYCCQTLRRSRWERIRATHRDPQAAIREVETLAEAGGLLPRAAAMLTCPGCLGTNGDWASTCIYCGRTIKTRLWRRALAVSGVWWRNGRRIIGSYRISPAQQEYVESRQNQLRILIPSMWRL